MDFKSLPFNEQIDEMLSSIHSDMAYTDDATRRNNLTRSAAHYRGQLTQPYATYKSELTRCMHELENGDGTITESFSTFITYLQSPPGNFRV